MSVRDFHRAAMKAQREAAEREAPAFDEREQAIWDRFEAAPDAFGYEAECFAGKHGDCANRTDPWDDVIAAQYAALDLTFRAGGDAA